ncbi:MAG TPA: YrdB family protein [Ktedonobacterales bacterium]|jgi:hypothetical protein
MNALKMANLALAFLLELCALAAFAWWGYQTGQGTLAKIALAVGAPLVVAVFWGLFVAPRAVFTLSPLWRSLLALVVFGAAAVALTATGQTALGLIFLVAAVLNRLLLFVWKQQAPPTQA